MPGSGLARGRSPRPAPDWLHQLPAWIRRSMRDWLTKVCTSVEGVAGARGGGRVRAPPAVAGGVDQHADVRREAGRDELLAVRLREAELVDVHVPVEPLGLAGLRAGH